ncbi:WGxxGxxG family protein [Priestia abyssalis]|uniref:WGxxGxxG family protein n=1 Tax=Priestia abyssalis TaxID=1221450 RepID=UPI000994C40A|nr:WGxxGxxG family protein [Priestia abyssalis]
MKKTLSSILCAFALAAMALGMPVHAEDNYNNTNRAYDHDATRTYDNTRVTPRNVATTTDINADNDTNWEWIGLLGLVGLLGLRRRREGEIR